MWQCKVDHFYIYLTERPLKLKLCDINDLILYSNFYNFLLGLIDRQN